MLYSKQMAQAMWEGKGRETWSCFTRTSRLPLDFSFSLQIEIDLSKSYSLLTENSSNKTKCIHYFSLGLHRSSFEEIMYVILFRLL